MVSKSELLSKLDALGIEYDANAKKSELEKLLANAEGSELKEEESIDKEIEKNAELDVEPKVEPIKEAIKKSKPQDEEKKVKPLKGDEILVVVNAEELTKLQKEGKLIGYDPKTKEARIKK